MRFTRVPWISCECILYTSQQQYDVNTLSSHHAQTLLYDHKLFLAPLKEGIEVRWLLHKTNTQDHANLTDTSQRALDVGTGTGIWAMCVYYSLIIYPFTPFHMAHPASPCIILRLTTPIANPFHPIFATRTPLSLTNPLSPQTATSQTNFPPAR